MFELWDFALWILDLLGFLIGYLLLAIAFLFSCCLLLSCFLVGQIELGCLFLTVLANGCVTCFIVVFFLWF